MVMSKAATVADYLAELPADQRKTISAVRAVVRKSLPKGYKESVGYGMICYNVPLSTYPHLQRPASQSVICLGGPMNVYEDKKYRFLKEEDLFVERIVEEEVPFLGICLGAQLIAKATGSRVTKNPEKEIGWYKIVLNDYGLKDDLFKDLPEVFNVFQWHGDTFGIPRGGKRLAFSELCQNQALKYGRNIYGIQFHVEVTKDMIPRWADAYLQELDSLKGIVSDKQKMLDDYVALEKRYMRQAEQFYVNFFTVAGLLKKKFFSFSHEGKGSK